MKKIFSLKIVLPYSLDLTLDLINQRAGKSSINKTCNPQINKLILIVAVVAVSVVLDRNITRQDSRLCFFHSCFHLGGNH